LQEAISFARFRHVHSSSVRDVPSRARRRGYRREEHVE
jgi:hypothetical protein